MSYLCHLKVFICKNLLRRCDIELDVVDTDMSKLFAGRRKRFEYSRCRAKGKQVTVAFDNLLGQPFVNNNGSNSKVREQFSSHSAHLFEINKKKGVIRLPFL